MIKLIFAAILTFSFIGTTLAEVGGSQLSESTAMENNLIVEGLIDEMFADSDFEPLRLRNGRDVTITCSSNSYRYAECGVGGRIVDAWVVRQISKSSCREGRSWGYRGKTLWVDKGCRATFRVVVRRRGGGGRTSYINCSSNSYRYNTCSAPGRIMNAYVETKHSRSACIEGHSWGYSGSTIWVDKGCRATFAVRTRGRRW